MWDGGFGRYDGGLSPMDTDRGIKGWTDGYGGL